MPTQAGADDVDLEAGVRVEQGPLSSLLLQVVRAHAAVASAMLAEIGLVAPQEVILLYLEDHGPVPQQRLVRYLNRDRSTVTTTLQALERMELVVRSPSAVDRRSMMVELTAKGSGLCPRVRRVWTELEARTFGCLSESERDSLAGTLMTIRDAARMRS
ncbi:MarR family winged helix-turn-helix transcriptional regulator [Saccharomonospora saliphila]|uniref:MarR family winged helix-turn-helix transcriptional regulator n=1 Tax=Saccharomonospora saliphila TaxID=369829 RepID=UPI00036BC17E|nr:MarR family transcriptional regulator [Saccharomonospora saliphila]